MKRFAFVAVLLVLPALAQMEAPKRNAPEVASVSLPTAPSAVVTPAPPVLPATPKSQIIAQAQEHARFLDRPAKIRFAILAGVIAADGITTQYVLNHDGGKEVNPLARPLVTHGAVGQFAASTIGFGFGVGTSYLFHRTGHHKLERMFQNVAIGVEAECVTNNLIQHALTNRGQ